MTSSLSRYRLRMSPLRRALTTLLLSLIAILFFVPGVLASPLGGWWRLMSAVGLVLSIVGLRIVLGPVIVVRDEGLRIQRNWPLRRDIPWYRIFQVDVIPGFWNLEIELNSGERIALPCVDEVDRLYEELERHRSEIDA
ncbi:hypothetical protein [Rhabdothermincola sp.]|uniref:hypothetical protein n=1 Tax=Rhabdothermincola sp. TaxID=2820405 RepID=UPI002FE25EA4